MTKVLASAWRDEGQINYLIPPVIAANSFIVLATTHSPWLCFFLEDMAVVLNDDDLPDKVKDTYHVTIEALRDGLSKRHKVERHESRMKRGTPDMFDGMLYGTIHPSECAALADELQTIAAAFVAVGEREAPMYVAWDFWMTTADKYVQPHEAIGPLWIGGVDE